MKITGLPKSIGATVHVGEFTIERLPDDIDGGRMYEVFPPEGFLFDAELSSLICFGAEDVRNRLKDCCLEAI